MDIFRSDDLVWFVAHEPVGRKRPIVAIIGQGAQTLATDAPQIASILWNIGVNERRFQTHSCHAKALLLHTLAERAESIAYYYGLAVKTMVDLWDGGTETPLADRVLELPARQWIHRLLRRRPSPPARKLRPCPSELFSVRFPNDGGSPTAIDHAQWLFAFGYYSKACAVLERYLADNPEDWAVHCSLGEALRDLAQEPVQAIRHFERAGQLAPDNAHVWNALGTTCGFVGDHFNACAAFKREAMLTDEFGAWMNVAMAALRIGDRQAARDAVHRAQQQGSDPLLYFVLAVLARQDGNQGDAERLLGEAEHAFRQMPAAARDALASLYVVEEARRTV